MATKAPNPVHPRPGISPLIKNLQLNLGSSTANRGAASETPRGSDATPPQSRGGHGHLRVGSGRGDPVVKKLGNRGAAPGPTPTSLGSQAASERPRVVKPTSGSGDESSTSARSTDGSAANTPLRNKSFKAGDRAGGFTVHDVPKAEKLIDFAGLVPNEKTQGASENHNSNITNRHPSLVNSFKNKTHQVQSSHHQFTTNSTHGVKPTVSTTKGPRPPALPSKVNRPRVQRPTESATSQDDWEVTSPEPRPEPVLRTSRSLDNLDAPDPACDVEEVTHSVKDELLALYKKSMGVATTQRDVEKQETPKKDTIPSEIGKKKAVSSPGFLRKKTKEVKEVDRTSKHEGDGAASKLKSRWSIGDRLRQAGMFEHLLKTQKRDSKDRSSKHFDDDVDAATDPSANVSRRNSLCEKKSSDQAVVIVSIPIEHVTPADDATDTSKHSSDPDSTAADSDDEYDDEDMYDANEWDDVDDEDVNQDSSPEESNKRKSCYENITNYTMTFKNRKRLVEEIVSSEQMYVSKLYLLNKTSWEISGANLMTEMLPASSVHRMFPCVEALYQLHSENILPALKHRLEQWNSQSELSSLWKKYLPFLTMYKTYTTQYDWALETLAQYKKSSSVFNSCLNQIQGRPEFGKLTLEQHLLEPIQRLTRYRLLLQNYSKLLTSDNTERENISDILDSFNELLNDCQSQLKRRDMFGDMCKLQEKFEDRLSVLTPTAQLVKQGPATQIRGSTSKKTSARQLFLFTDWLLVCSKRHTSGKFHIIHQLALSDLQIESVDPSTKQLFGEEKTIKIVTEETNVQLHFKEGNLKGEWSKNIVDLKLKSKRKQQLRRDGTNSDDGGK